MVDSFAVHHRAPAGGHEHLGVVVLLGGRIPGVRGEDLEEADGCGTHDDHGTRGEFGLLPSHSVVVWCTVVDCVACLFVADEFSQPDALGERGGVAQELEKSRFGKHRIVALPEIPVSGVGVHEIAVHLALEVRHHEPFDGFHLVRLVVASGPHAVGGVHGFHRT